MISEEEFRNLSEDLETVGHYTPTVRDMFRFLAEKKGYMRVDPENPKVWKGSAMVKKNRECKPNLANLEYFPEAGRFEAAIEELLTANEGGEDMTIYPRMAREFGLELQMTFTTFTAQFIVTLTPDDLISEYEKYKALINKL